MTRRDDEHTDDPMPRDYPAWQRWQRDTTPIEYWHSLDLTYQAYVEACQQQNDDEEEAA